MTVSQTTRLDLYTWSASEDEFTREQMTSSHQSLEDNVAIFVTGTSVTPPTASTGNTNAFYWDTTSNILHFRGDDSWQQIFPVLPGGHIHTDLQPLNSNLTGFGSLSGSGFVSRTGSNTFTERSIAVSGTGLSISNAGGVAGDPTISINSTSSATASTVVSRDSSGRFQAVSPSANADVAIKSYVDTADALKANAADVYTKTEMADPTTRAFLNLQTLDADLTALSALSTVGIVARTAADTYATRSIAVSGSGLTISNATGAAGNPTIAIASDSTATPSTIVLRDAAGRFQAVSPSANADVAIKSYVDTADALKANSADVYTKTDLHNAKLYQYANTGGGTGTALPPSGTRTTPRIYVQTTDPGTSGAIVGDIWFQI